MEVRTSFLSMCPFDPITQTANAVRYGTARGEWLLNLVCITSVDDILTLRKSDSGASQWRDHQNKKTGQKTCVGL